MFIYFVPTEVSIVNDEIEQILPYAWPRHGCQGCQVRSGPLGTGLILARKELPSDLVFTFGDVKDWHKIPGKNAYVKQVAPATHDGLKRRDDEFLDGYNVDINGQYWLIPRALLWTSPEQSTTALPRFYALQDNGEWGHGDILPRYRKLWDVTTNVVLKLNEGEDVPLADRLNSVVVAFQTHYYVDSVELSQMGVLHEAMLWPVWFAMLDEIRRYQLKKNAAELGLSSGLGSLDGSTPSCQALQTSER